MSSQKENPQNNIEQPKPIRDKNDLKLKFVALRNGLIEEKNKNNEYAFISCNTIKYIENRCLDPWIRQKTIQKAVESYRVSDEHKEYLKKFR